MYPRKGTTHKRAAGDDLSTAAQLSSAPRLGVSTTFKTATPRQPTTSHNQDGML